MCSWYLPLVLVGLNALKFFSDGPSLFFRARANAQRRNDGLAGEMGFKDVVLIHHQGTGESKLTRLHVGLDQLLLVFCSQNNL